jgi:putative membrane protein
MELLQKFLIGFVAFIHLYFLYLEMFLWSKPKGLKTFKIDAEFAAKSATLAANQGLYNGFLAAGLIWSLVSSQPEISFQLKIFFLTCVIVAGVYGAMTVNKRILFLQAMPAFIAGVLVLLTK